MAKKATKKAAAKVVEQDGGEIGSDDSLMRFRAAALAASKEKGGGTVIPASDFDCDLKFLEIPDLAYQYALGRPGYAMGRIQTLIGFEGTSKTSKQLWLCNLAMKQGGLAAAVFVEHADSTFHMKQYIEEYFMPYFMCYVCDTLEEAIQRSVEIQNLFKKIDPNNKLLKVQVFDSVAGATQEKLLEEDREMGAPKVGGIGVVMADFVNTMKTLIARSNTMWAVNNQAREIIDVGFSGPPKPELEKLVSKGGKALPFHSTYFEVIKKNGSIRSESDMSHRGKVVEGFSTTLTFKKNKLGVPFREVRYDVVWGEGLDFSEHTMGWLASASICGVEKRPNTSKYFSREMGIDEKSALPLKEMYDLIHSPEWISHFQRELMIITEVDRPSGLDPIPINYSRPLPALTASASASPPPPPPDTPVAEAENLESIQESAPTPPPPPP